MTIAILETGRPPERLRAAFPSYGRMVADLVGPGRAYACFDAQSGRLPEAPFAGYVVTGSAAGAYDPDPWIVGLVAFLRGLDPAARVVGLCFGHQVMAAAWGGRVEKSDRGWGLGLHRYDIVARAPFMDAGPEAGGTLALPASHQDQVVMRPPGARVLAASAFTPHAVLAYEDRAALSFQGHPEFDAPFARALTRGHRATAGDPERERAALDSLDGPHDSARVGGWIRRFLEA